MNLDILFIFLQKKMRVFSSGYYGGGDVVVMVFKHLDDFLCGLIIRLSTLRIEFSQYFVKTSNGCL